MHAAHAGDHLRSVIRHIVRIAAGLLAPVVLLSCGGEGGTTVPIVLGPSSITVSGAPLSLDAAGATVQLTATVRDQNGQLITGAAIQWTTSAPTVATVSAAGLVTAVGEGTAEISATTAGLTASVAVSVAISPVAPVKLAGDAQTGAAGSALPIPLQVKVVDRLGGPVSGRAVTFAVAQGGGSLAPSTAMTGSDGVASAVWTVGTTALAPNEVRATVAGLSAPAIFTATVVAGAAAQLAIAAGNGQTAPVGAAVAVAPSVRVADTHGNPVTGVTVTFAVTGGGGSVTGATATSNASGIAAAGAWTLGPTPGPNALTAVATGLPNASFTATATAGPPAAVALASLNNQSAEVGSAVAAPPAVRVTDARNNPVAGVPVAFAVTEGGGAITGSPATTNADGVATAGNWTLGTASGTVNRASATVEGLPPVFFAAMSTAAAPASVSIVAGNGQSAPAGAPVAIPPTVRVLDRYQNPVPGALVTFAVTGGAGAVSSGTVNTGALGRASVGSWTLGAEGANTLTATVAGTGITGNPATFTATATGASSYQMELRLLSGPLSPGQAAAFASAVARWQAIITQDLTSIPVNLPTGSCGSNAPAVNEIIDDLVIFVTVTTIDGPFGVLGSAGPCLIRGSNNLPALGLMRFDVADLDRLEQDGRLESVILHEMGHVLGIGTLWNAFNLLVNPSVTGGSGVDTHFIGTNAQAGFDQIGGVSYTGGAKVPVANTANAGSADAHWRESVLVNELMTPTINAGTNPLSVLSIRSLQDLGYAVSTAPADAFFLALSIVERPAGAPPDVLLLDDVSREPIYRVDARGRILNIIRRQ